MDDLVATPLAMTVWLSRDVGSIGTNTPYIINDHDGKTQQEIKSCTARPRAAVQRYFFVRLQNKRARLAGIAARPNCVNSIPKKSVEAASVAWVLRSSSMHRTNPRNAQSVAMRTALILKACMGLRVRSVLLRAPPSLKQILPFCEEPPFSAMNEWLKPTLIQPVRLPKQRR